jgi:hypothetical protein
VRLELDRRSCCPQDADELVIFHGKKNYLWCEMLVVPRNVN